MNDLIDWLALLAVLNSTAEAGVVVAEVKIIRAESTRDLILLSVLARNTIGDGFNTFNAGSG